MFCAVGGFLLLVHLVQTLQKWSFQAFLHPLKKFLDAYIEMTSDLTLLLATLACAGPLTAAAQVPAQHIQSDDGAPLSLDAAVKATVSENLDVVALRRQLGMLRLRPGQEHSLPPPMVGVQIWQWPVNTLNPWKTNFYMPMITQELPGRGKRQLRAALAEKEVELAQTDVTMRERDVINLVKQAYVDLFIARKAIDIHLASVDLLRQIADMSQAKYAGGAISQQDVLKGIVEISKVHGDLLMLDEEAQLAAARLNTLMNRPIDAAIGPLDEPHERAVAASIDELRAAALANKPELVAARQEVEHAEAELAIAKQDYKPDFSVQAGYMLMPGNHLAASALVARKSRPARPGNRCADRDGEGAAAGAGERCSSRSRDRVPARQNRRAAGVAAANDDSAAVGADAGRVSRRLSDRSRRRADDSR